MPFTSAPPPEPDLIAPRNTDQWRDAVHAKKQWISQQLARGASLDDLVNAGVMDKYGEGGSPREGRLSHDYEYWQNAIQGKETGDEGMPGELGEAQWDIGNFRRQASQGDWTEWPPGSGRFFNDPANDSMHREWRDNNGDRIAPPEDGGPDIDYANMIGGETPAAYLKRREGEQAAEKRAKPLLPGKGPVNNTTDKAPTPINNQKADTTTPQPNYSSTFGQPNPIPPQQSSYYQQVQQPQSKPNNASINQPSGQLPSRYQGAISGQPNQPSVLGGGNQPQPRQKKVGAAWYSTWS